MQVGRGVWGGGVVLLALLAAPASAVYLDGEDSVQLLGRMYSQAALRTEESSGLTFPHTPRGHVVQSRNLVEIELAQALDRRFTERPAWLGDLGYRLRFKGVYEGVWDYGPEEYSEQVEVSPPSPFDPQASAQSRTVHRARINRRILGRQYELWNAYVQGSAGPLFLRVGRQDLSWGETDGFRLLDMIEPLDNRFGFPLVEDLDDRRMPLWMVRATLALPWQSEDVTNLTLDSFFVPAQLDDQEAPIAPRGSPFAAPAPPSFFDRRVTRPGRTPGDSRGGGRLIGTLFADATVSVAHYVTWNDSSAARVRITRVDLVDGKPVARPALDFVFYQQQVTGGTFTMHVKPPIDTVVRAEAAMFWDERVFDPVRAGSGASFPLLVGEAIADRLSGGPGRAAGGFTPRDVFRWVIGFDKVFWLRALNPTNTFSFSTQLFHTHVLDHDDGIRNGITNPDTRDFVPRKQDEFTNTFLLSTLLWRGRLQPSVFASYDPRGVLAAVPGLTWLIGTHVRLTAKYALVRGNFANLGFFRDRDEVLLRAEVSL
ncbi:MAG: hypothetical protein HYY35_11320 [Deltaproteobacteria bacterium]|nr:hypothetical protein [Deltaproteobacteria bacterium]